MGRIGKVPTGKFDFDIDAREKQIIGEGPRLAPLKLEEIGEDAMAQIQNIQSAFNLPHDTPIPDVSLITLRNPAMFSCQMAMGIELAGNGTIPGRERELAVLRLAWLAGAAFEWSEHVDIGKKFGVTQEEIDRIKEGSSATGWSEHEAAVLRAVEECLADQCIGDVTWETLTKTYDEKQLLELPMLIGSYLMTAFQQNSLRVPPKAGFRYR
ncbi:MAG: carboxymuconolactone decarboxylase family protein [Novosphingobium sp.]|nr:carboxymuconolactone decarboxylase family protein [Novosphingobium sp.]